MYFALEINKQLANALRAAAEAKAEIGIFKKEEESENIKRTDIMEVIDELDENLCFVITRIADLACRVICDSVIDESDKEINNRSTTQLPNEL